MALCCSFRRLSRSHSSDSLSKEELSKSQETTLTVIHEPRPVTEELSKSPVTHEPLPGTVEPSKSGVIYESQEEPKDPFDEFEFRTRSASEPRNSKKSSSPRSFQNSKSPTPSLRDIPEETTQLPPTLYHTSQHVIANPSVLSESSLSLPYHTPPSSRRSMQFLQVSDCDGHPLSVKMGGTEQDRKKQHLKASTETLPPSPSQLSSQGEDRFATLITKIDKLGQETQKQHQELIEIILQLSKKLDMIETELHTNSKDKEVAVNSDVLHSPERGEVNESKLPQNCSVNTEVLLGLAKVLPKWKFLARRLQIPEHEIQQISENSPVDVQEQSYQMLLKWNQTNAQNSDSYNTLGEAVRKECGDQLYSSYVKMVIDTVNNCTHSQ